VNDAWLATAAVIEFRPDGLVLDLIMPEKDGPDMLNEVLVINPSVRLVLSSGFGDSHLRLGDARSKFHRDNGAEILRKPFLVAALRGCCGARLKPPDPGATGQGGRHQGNPQARAERVVELRGIEPLTSSLRTRRSPS
jgi:hypothetical protein